MGRNSNDISFCYSRGCVNGGERVGGLVGDNYGNIESCYSTSVVIGTKNYVGGLAGASWKEIAYCYSAGLVIGDDIFTGGLVGYGRRTFNSFWDIESSGQTTSNSENGRTTAEMQTESTFTDAGWDFAGETVNGTGDIWWILEGQDYPRLWWEAEQRDE